MPLAGVYEDYKHMRYDVMGTAIEADTGDEYVVYRPLFGLRTLSVILLAEFEAHVDSEDGPRPRFKLVYSNQGGP